MKRLAWMAALVAASHLVGTHGASAQGWYDSTWSFRRTITVANSGALPLTDYQVQVTLDSTFVFAGAKGDGSDIRFTSEDGVTSIPFWIESWNPVSRLAILWAKVPLIPAGSNALIYMYYGNTAASDAGNGNTTFDFFDDFESSTTTEYGYYGFSGSPTPILTVHQAWETSSPHTLSVVELNRDGYQYWGYYSLERYPEGGPVGLARSNDLANWVKYDANPILPAQKRWVSVLNVGTSLYMAYTDYTTVSSIVLAVSEDGPGLGTSFTDVKTLVQPEAGYYNGSPNLFHNPNDGLYYMYYLRINTGTNYRDILVRCAATIEDLDTAQATILASSAVTFAAPNMMFQNGAYFLTVEMLINSIWETDVLASSSPTGGFNFLPGNPVFGNGVACWFQHFFGDTLHVYYAKQTGGVWTMEHRSADLTAGRVAYSTPGVLDTAKWTPSGGRWTTALVTQQDGSTGVVAQGATLAIQALRSKGFSGTDYVVEVYGRQISGPEWGLCARATGPATYFVSCLYDNHDATDNLYTYHWRPLPTTHPILGKTALGTINPNTWYKMAVKVYADTVATFVNGVQRLKVRDTTQTPLSSGGIALFGENGTVAQFNDLRVRKFAAVEPTITVGSEQALPIQLASFTAVVANGTVHLTWITLSELNNYGFIVQRKRPSDTGFNDIPNSFQRGHNTTNEPHTYTFTDTPGGSGTWLYRLKQIDFDGTLSYCEPIQVDVLTHIGDGDQPLAFGIQQNYPNPFNPTTTIEFSVTVSGPASLRIYNPLGQEVATLIDGELKAGIHRIEWQALNMPSGVYLCRLDAQERSAATKLLLMK